MQMMQKLQGNLVLKMAMSLLKAGPGRAKRLTVDVAGLIAKETYGFQLAVLAQVDIQGPMGEPTGMSKENVADILMSTREGESEKGNWVNDTQNGKYSLLFTG
jgi:hypothetical protein